MNIETSSEIEIMNFLRAGNVLVIDAKNDPSLSKALYFHIDHLESLYTYHRWTPSSIDAIKMLIYYICNISNIVLVHKNYPYLLKLSFVWRELKWLKVKTESTPPCSEYKISYVESKHNLSSYMYPKRT